MQLIWILGITILISIISFILGKYLNKKFFYIIGGVLLVAILVFIIDL